MVGMYVLRTPRSTHPPLLLPHKKRWSRRYVMAIYIRSGILLHDTSDTSTPFLCRKIPFTSLKDCPSTACMHQQTRNCAVGETERGTYAYITIESLFPSIGSYFYPLKMAEKVQGSVKWFSNRKGYGFITPAEGSSITEDIFVHQSSIFCEGYRTLVSQ